MKTTIQHLLNIMSDDDMRLYLLVAIQNGTSDKSVLQAIQELRAAILNPPEKVSLLGSFM